MRLTRNGAMRCSRSTLAFERPQCCAGTPGRWTPCPVPPAFFQIMLRLSPHLRRSPARRRQIYPGTTGLRKTDRNGLPCRPDTMHTLAGVMKFFAHKLTGLGGGRFALPGISSRASQRLCVRHMPALSSVLARMNPRGKFLDHLFIKSRNIGGFLCGDQPVIHHHVFIRP